MVCMNGLFEIGQISKYLKPFKFISKGCKVYNVKLVGDHREKLTKAVVTTVWYHKLAISVSLSNSLQLYLTRALTHQL